MSFFAFTPWQLLQNADQVSRQRSDELHWMPIARVLEGKAFGVQEGAVQTLHGAQVARHAAMEAPVQRVADDRMTDGTEMDANLVRPACVNGDLAQRHSAEVTRPRNARDSLPRPPCTR